MKKDKKNLSFAVKLNYEFFLKRIEFDTFETVVMNCFPFLFSIIEYIRKL